MNEKLNMPCRAGEILGILERFSFKGIYTKFSIDLKHNFFGKTGFFKKIRFVEHTKTSFCLLISGLSKKFFHI